MIRMQSVTMLALALLALPSMAPIGAAVPRTDVYGDPLPEGVRVRMGTVQLRHDEAQVLFSADGRALISCGQRDGLVRHWSVATGRLVREMQLGGMPPQTKERASVSLGGRCAVIKTKNVVIIYNVESGEERGRMPLQTESLRGLTPSGDGKLLLVESDAGPNHTVAELWDVARGKKIQSGKYEFGVWKAVFSPNGKRLALKTGHQDLRIWDTAGGKETHTKGVGGWSLCFSPDGKSLAVSGLNGPIQLLDASTLKEQGQLKRPENHVQPPTCLEYSGDGQLLAALSDKEILVWDIGAHKLKYRQPADRAFALAFAPDGTTLACWGWQLGSEICLWDVAAGKKLHARPGHGKYADVLAVSPDGKTVASGAMHDSRLHVWDTATGRLLARLKGADDWIMACAFCLDGKHLVSGGCHGTLQLWDVARAKEVRRLEFAKMPARNFTFDLDSIYLKAAPDGKRLSLILIGANAFAAVWDLTDGKVLSRRPYHVELHRRDNPNGSYETWTETHVAFAPDGQSVTVKNSQGLVIEDLQSRRILTRMPEKTGRPVAFAPDGQVLAAAALQPKDDPFLAATMVGLRLIETATGQEVLSIKTGEGHLLDFSLDGRLLASVDKEAIHIWEVVSGKEFFRRPWPKGVAASADFSPATSLTFLPQGRGVVTGMRDGAVLVWDVPARRAPIRAPKPEALETSWSALAGEARAAHVAVYALTATPKATVSFLAERLKPAAEVEDKRLTKLLADLDSDRFETREGAANELVRLCDDIEPALRRFLQSKPSLEARRRTEAILDSPRPLPTAATLRTLRAIRVLEAIDTAEARQVLRTLAEGAAAARPTREAKAALHRLAWQTP
jgi:WD40 repeat protein